MVISNPTILFKEKKNICLWTYKHIHNKTCSNTRIWIMNNVGTWPWFSWVWGLFSSKDYIFVKENIV